MACLSLERLEARDLPAPVTYHGGPVVTRPEVENLFVGAPRPDVVPLEHVLASEYLPVLSPYGVGAGTVGASALVPGTGPVATDAQLRGLLAGAIATGQLPPPDGNRIYAVFTAAGITVVAADGTVSGRDFLGYHDSAVLPTPGVLPGIALAPYLVVPRLDYPLSVVLSHELAEAATDPLPGSGWFAGSTRDEIGDVYNSEPAPLDGYQVQVLAAPDGSRLLPGPASRALALWNLAVAQVTYRTLELQAGRGLATAPQCLQALDVVLSSPLARTPEGLTALAQADIYVYLYIYPLLTSRA